MKTRKLRTFGRRTFLAIAAILTLALSACPDDNSKNEPETPSPHTPTTITVSFDTVTAGATIDFSPNTPLPTGITYTVTDNSTPQKSWNSKNGFNGKITASDHYTAAGPVTFTQTFYFNGVEITGTSSKRIVVVSVAAFPSVSFGTITSDTGSVTLTY